MKIDNDLKLFSPAETGQAGYNNVFALVSGLISLVGGLASLVFTPFFLPVLLFGLTLYWPLRPALKNGNLSYRLGSRTNVSRRDYYPYDHISNFKMSGRERAYRYYHRLPEEVRRQIGNITLDAFLEMDDNQAKSVGDKFESVKNAYEHQQRLLKRPAVQEIMRNLDSVETAYRENNRQMKELSNM